MTRIVKIYGLAHPDTGVVWYVGASGHPSLRVRAHRKRGAKKVRAWIASLPSPPTTVILENATFENWGERERYWIAEHRAKNSGLLNTSDGGGTLSLVRNTRTNIYLTEHQLAAIRAEAARLGVPTAELIRRICDAFIEKVETRNRKEGAK